MSKTIGQLPVEISNPRLNRKPIDTSPFSIDSRAEVAELIARFQQIHEETEAHFSTSTELEEIHEEIQEFNRRSAIATIQSAENDAELRQKLDVIRISEGVDVLRFLTKKLNASTRLIRNIVDLITIIIKGKELSPDEKQQLYIQTLRNRKTMHGIACLGFASQVPTLDCMRTYNIEDFDIVDGALIVTPEGYERVKALMYESTGKYNGCTATFVSHSQHNNAVTAHTRWTLDVFAEYYTPFASYSTE